MTEYKSLASGKSIYTWGNVGNAKIDVKYAYERSGANVLYKIYVYLYKNSSSYFNDDIGLQVKLDGTQVYYDTEFKNGSGGWPAKLEQVFTVNEKTSGTTTLYIRLWDSQGDKDFDKNYSYSLEVPDAQSTFNSISNFTLGNSFSPIITKYNSGFYDVLKVKSGSTIIKTINNVVTGTQYSFTTGELNTIYNLMPTSNSITLTFELSTYTDSTMQSLLGSSSKNAIATLIDANPIFNASQITYQDSNSTVVNITGNNQWIVRNKSNLKVTFTSATAQKGASISNYIITFNGSSQTKTSASTIDYGILNVSNNLPVTIKVTDSRGNTTTISKTIIVYDWVTPSAVITASRINNYEDTTRIKVQATISSVNGKNAIQSIKYRYKKTSDSSYSNYTSISNNTQYSFSIAKAYSWNVQVLVTDKFGSTTFNLVVAKGTSILFIDIDKLSVGVNKFPTNNNSLDLDKINGKSVLDLTYPVGAIYLSVNSTNPSSLFGGTWEQLQNRFLLGAGSSYSNGTTGGEATVTLTTNQMPSHTHTQKSCTDPGNHNHKYGFSSPKRASDGSKWWTAGNSSSDVGSAVKTTDAGSHTHTIELNNTGGGQAHNNMPPYLVVYMWKRTA